jgi:hypothetical protein
MANFGLCGEPLLDSATGDLVRSYNSGSLKVPQKFSKISERIDGILVEFLTGYISKTSSS